MHCSIRWRVATNNNNNFMSEMLCQHLLLLAEVTRSQLLIKA